MNIQIREYKDSDIQEMNRIWNRVVDDGVAFPQEDDLTEETGRGFFAGQTYTAVAEDTDTGKVLGLYILHPNNVGRCGHICNASYAVDADVRGIHIGAKIVSDCLVKEKEYENLLLQYRKLVHKNLLEKHLYERLGFTQLGTIPGGFRMKDGHYEDICPYYFDLRELGR